MPRELIGETLLNQFRVETYIASGGMATIFRVWDIQRSVPLAMKVLHPELADDPSFIARFQREADSLQRLIHPHIVPFYGLFRADELTFMLERYIDGPSLDEILRRRNGRPMALGEALVYLKALYTSLGYAHAQGIIHCDIKPGNVLIDQGGHVYLTDFGIARYVDSSTTTSSTMGTPLYMAPEQIRGERAVPQTDVYSLGVLMFELLTGQRPFRGSGDIPAGVGASPSDRIRYQHLNFGPPDPRMLNPDLPEGIARVLLRSMEKLPGDRYPSVISMADDISQVVAARFETLPDRVRLPEELRRAYDWTTPTPPQPVELAPGIDSTKPGDWSWDADRRQRAYEPANWQPAPDWTDPYQPQQTYPGDVPVHGPAPHQRRLPALPMRWVVGLASLVLLFLCGLVGASLVRGISGGFLLGSTATAQVSLPDPVKTLTSGDPSATIQATERSEPSQTAAPTNTGVPAENPTATTVPVPTQTEVLPPLASFPVSGEIAIIHRQEGIDRLSIFNAENGEANLVPSVPGVEADLYHSPQWSPDGQKLVWVSRYNGKLHVVAMDMEEREPYQLPAGEAFQRVSSPAWLPDGQRVTFWAAGGGGNYLVTADGTTGEELDRSQLSVYRNMFVWNWQNGLPAFVQQFSGQYGVVVSSSPQTVEQSIDSGGEEYAPSWSNDGQWLAFQSDTGREAGLNEIWISRADGSELRKVTTTPQDAWARAPSWSPDGRMIAFVSNRSGSIGNDFGELFVVNLESGETRQMTNTAGRVYDWRPAWRP